MARFSIGTAIGEAFGLIRRRPLAVFVWGLLMVVPMLVSFALILPMMGGALSSIAADAANPDQIHEAMMGEMMQIQGVSSLLNLVQLLVSVVVYTAVMRAVVRPRETSFFSLRLGMDELRVAVVGLAIIVGFYFAALILVLLGVGIGFATWGLGEPFNWLITDPGCHNWKNLNGCTNVKDQKLHCSFTQLNFQDYAVYYNAKVLKFMWLMQAV